jgi:hypothetical protein
VPLTVAAVKGDVKLMFTYRDHDDEQPTGTSQNTSVASEDLSSDKDAKKEK